MTGAIAAVRTLPILAIALRVVTGAGILGLVLFLSFKWGETSQKAAHEKDQRELAQQYARDLDAAKERSYNRGVEAARREESNEKELDQIVREAQGLDGADDECIPADIVERLRQLQ